MLTRPETRTTPPAPLAHAPRRVSRAGTPRNVRCRLWRNRVETPRETGAEWNSRCRRACRRGARAGRGRRERPRERGLAHRPIRGRSSMKQTVSQKLIDRPGNSALLLHEARETTGHAHDCTSLLEFPSSTESDVCATAPQPLQYLKRLSCLWNAMVLKSCCEKKKLAVLW